MKWILFIIFLSSSGEYELENLGKYDNMVKCFEQWQYINDKLTDNGSKSKTDVQIICLQSSEESG